MTETREEHPVFGEFRNLYTGGTIPAFHVNFVGQKTNQAFVTVDVGAYAEGTGVQEERFEWLALLEAILEARRTLVIFELGAGYGRWLVAAACAARLRRPDLTVKLLGVEPEPKHFEYMLQHFRENQLNPQAHELVEAVLNGSGRSAHFIVGHPQEWYGQAIVPEGFAMDAYPAARTVSLPAVKLVDLLQPYAYVDLIDMDIQGAELEVIEPSIEAMTRTTRRVFVSTHSQEIHAALAGIFQKAGWSLVAMHGWTGDYEDSLFGKILFGDGIQYWINPRIGPSPA